MTFIKIIITIGVLGLISYIIYSGLVLGGVVQVPNATTAVAMTLSTVAPVSVSTTTAVPVTTTPASVYTCTKDYHLAGGVVNDNNDAQGGKCQSWCSQGYPGSTFNGSWSNSSGSSVCGCTFTQGTPC